MFLEDVKLVNPKDFNLVRKFREIISLFPEEFDELGRSLDWLCFPGVYAFIVEDKVAIVFFITVPGLKATIKFAIRNKMILRDKKQIITAINILMKFLNVQKLEGFIPEDMKNSLKFMTWIGAKISRLEKAMLDREGNIKAQFLAEYLLPEPEPEPEEKKEVMEA